MDQYLKDPWDNLTRFTPARIALGRTGASLPTREVLRFAAAHARARDAVHASPDFATIAGALTALGLATLDVESDATDRSVYLRRPDYGRRLSDRSRAELTALGSKPADLAIVIADGLSAAAVDAHAVPLVAALLPQLKSLGLSVGPIVLARGARVALGDEVAEKLGARAVAVLIGERPGLSSPDSLGIYLTFAPRVGRTDAERNCISNCRPEGLKYEPAAFKLAWLIKAALARGLTGVALKDDSDKLLTGGAAPPLLAS